MGLCRDTFLRELQHLRAFHWLHQCQVGRISSRSKGLQVTNGSCTWLGTNTKETTPECRVADILSSRNREGVGTYSSLPIHAQYILSDLFRNCTGDRLKC